MRTGHGENAEPLEDEVEDVREEKGILGILRKGYSIKVGEKTIIGDGKRKVALDRERAKLELHKFDNTTQIRKHFGFAPIPDRSRTDPDHRAARRIQAEVPEGGGLSMADVLGAIDKSEKRTAKMLADAIDSLAEKLAAPRTAARKATRKARR